MKNVQFRKAGSSLQLRDGFKKAAPLPEGIQSLSEEPMGRLAVVFSSPSKARDQLLQFLDTREKLSREFGARIDLVQESHGTRVSVMARLEMETSDRTLDLDTEQLAVSRGFSLKLIAKLVTGPDSLETVTVDQGGGKTTEFKRQKLDAVYVVSESPNSPQNSPERVADYAKALFALAEDLGGSFEVCVPPSSSDLVSMSSPKTPEVLRSSILPDLAAVSALKTKL